MTLSASQLERALQRMGERLKGRGETGRVRLFVVGGSAALLSGLLSESRTTGDVDVVGVEPAEAWAGVCEVAGVVAKELGLPVTWLNGECGIYAWSLPLGWKRRSGRALALGPLEVWTLNRKDFIAAKIVSAPGRPQDLEDLLTIAPTDEELRFAAAHIDRLEREHLDPDHSLEDARVILESLRGGK